jgi:hypothetical protein
MWETILLFLSFYSCWTGAIRVIGVEILRRSTDGRYPPPKKKERKKKRNSEEFFLNAPQWGMTRCPVNASRDTLASTMLQQHIDRELPPPTTISSKSLWTFDSIERFSSVTCSSSSRAKPNGTIVALHVTSRSISPPLYSSNGGVMKDSKSP